MEKKFKAKVSRKKLREVEKLKELIRDNSVIGLVDMTDLPALQLLKIKSSLRDVMKIRMSKKRLLKRVFNDLKDERKGIEVLIDKLKGLPAIICSKEEPIRLAKLISKNKSMATAKSGQTAPTDLVVPAGPTPFMAGPMIGELGAMGIKTKVEAGKISVLKDTILVKQGMVIDAKKADLLAKLGIEPMEIGLNLYLTFKDGEILTKEVLFVNEEEYINNIKLAINESLALTLSIGYVTKDNIKMFLGKAYSEAKALSKEGKFMTEENIGEKLASAEKQAEKLKEIKPVLDGVTKEEVKEIEKEQKKIEEKPKEPVKEEKSLAEIRKEVLNKNEDVKIEGQVEATKDEMEMAKRKLQELVDKKIKGEI